MAKTIVMIGNTSWGMLQFRAETMKHFLSLGHRIIVVAPSDAFSPQIEQLGCTFIPLTVDRKGKNPFRDLAYILKLLHIFIVEKPDVVIAYTIKPVLYAPLAAKLAGVPLRIAVTTGLGYLFSMENRLARILSPVFPVLLSAANEVWFLNSEDRDVFLMKNLILPEKVFILPGEGVNTDYYIPSGPNPNNTFTFIGRMLWSKGAGIFVECAEALKASHPHLRFLLVGPIDSGNPEAISPEQLQEWHEKGIVSYRGALKDVREVLKETTCVVHPNYFREGVPRVLMEASSMGIPSIASDITGCREVIRHEVNGLLIEPGSSGALKSAMIHFLSLSEASRAKLSQSGREMMVSLFSSEKINRIYEQRLGL